MYPELMATMAAKGWNRRMLAEATGKTQPTISNFLNGKMDPKLSFCYTVKRALGTNKPIEELFRWEER